MTDPVVSPRGPQRGEAPAHMSGGRLLTGFLDVAVPLEMQRLAVLDSVTLCEIARTAGQVVAEHGDLIQFRAPGTASATASLIRGLAAAALITDGGITFAGRHWCKDHAGCLQVAS